MIYYALQFCSHFVRKKSQKNCYPKTMCKVYVTNQSLYHSLAGKVRIMQCAFNSVTFFFNRTMKVSRTLQASSFQLQHLVGYGNDQVITQYEDWRYLALFGHMYRLFLVQKYIWFFGSQRVYFQPLRAETLQDGLYICPEQRQVAPIFILSNHLIIPIPYLQLPTQGQSL